MSLSSSPFDRAPFDPMPSAPAASSGRWSRRCSTRRDVRIGCQAVRERDFTLVAERTLDVSVDGMLLVMRKPVLTGEPLIISFAIPGMWIDAEAIVSRVIHSRRPSDDGFAIGVVFDVMSHASKAALAGFLHGRPPPLPRRGPLGRLRRGGGAPRLADDAVIEGGLRDFPRRPPRAPSTSVDGLGMLRALVGAWRSIGASDG